MSRSLNPKKTKGGQQEVFTADEELRGLAKAMLIQMKITNTYLSIITGEELNESDIETGDT